MAGNTTARLTIQRWDSFEHIDLGNVAPGGPTALITLTSHDREFPERADPAQWSPEWATRLAKASPDQVRAASKGLTYGEVVALMGDFYATFEDLNRAPLTEIIELVPLIHATSSTTDLQKATGGRYLDLAAKNVSHFSNVPAGQRNIDVWHSNHADAIKVAAFASGNAQLTNLAWAMNAAADHFLTDAFSGGHVRTPRADLLKKGVSGQIESKVLHDLDNQYGVQVTNKRGDRPWVAFGDASLTPPMNATNRSLAVEAVKLSKEDIRAALAQGAAAAVVSATGRYAAEDLVPFPVDPAKDRWTGRTPTYDFDPVTDSPYRRPDDYSQVQDQVIRTEAPGIARGLFKDDDDIRGWVGKTPASSIGIVNVEEKMRMIDTLLGGFFSWIGDDDISAIEKILSSVSTGSEMKTIRDRFYSKLTSRMTSTGQVTRVRIALMRI